MGAFAQNSVIDSLRNALKQAQEDAVIVEYSVDLALHLVGVHPDSAHLLCIEARKLALKIEDPQKKVMALRRVGLGYLNLPQLDTALVLLKQARQMAEDIDFKRGLGFTLNSLGNVYRSKDEPELALEHFQKALKIHRERGDLDEQSAALSNIGLIHMERGEYAKASPYYKEGIAIQHTIGNKTYQAIFFQNLAVCEKGQNKFKEAIAASQEALERWVALDNKEMQALVMSSIGNTYKNGGDFTGALELHQQALNIRKTIGNKKLIASSMQNLGNLYNTIEDHPKATEYYQDALQIYQELDDKRGQAIILNNLGRSLTAAGNYTLALTHLHQALHLRQNVGPQRSLPYPVYNLGSTYEKMNRQDSAFYYLNKASDLADQYKNVYLQTLCFTDLGQLYQKRGEIAKAATILEQAYLLSPSETYLKEKLTITNLLYEIYKRQNKLAKALQFHERFKAIQDTIFNTENALEIARLEANHYFEQQKNQLEFEQIKEVNRQKSARRMTTIALIVALLFILTISWYVVQKQRANTQLKQLNAEMLQQKIELEQLNKVKSRFFANISHELRTPLTLIIGPIQNLMDQGEVGNKAKVYLQLMQENGKKLLERINEILDLSKIDAQKLEVKETSIDLYDLLKSTLSNYDALAKQQQLQLHFNYQIANDFKIIGDPDKLERILNNYLSNAVKYTDKDGAVTLSVRKEEEVLEFAVSDTGQGIKPEEIPHIFDRFYQASNAENRGGTGIGLALCKELAELMGGQVWVESKLHQGSTFYLKLPVKTLIQSEQKLLKPADSVPTEIKKASSVPAPIVTDKEANVILLVEDNPSLRTYITEVLSDYHLFEAMDGEEALTVLQTNPNLQKTPPALILSDIMMPRMDGYTLLGQLKKEPQWQHIPVIMLTSRSAEEDKLKALQLGVDDYLTKPFSPRELQLRVQNLIGNARQRLAFHKKNTSGIEVQFDAVPAIDQRWLQQLETAAKKALEQQQQLSKSFLADQMALSERQLLRRLKSLTGLTVHQYVLEIKLQKARHLLENKTYQTLAEVAYACGFNSPSHFSQTYTKHYGKRPGTY